ncbi:hypothetical protein [Candidatus Walczuchella monophlebidarum]|uniref:Uncharacterized protein n=1 Tax=Candidatus Walczuchella monophlebidarum TaxID=1415657 RepID=A0A068DNN7_9FLAO|nr:hypothetical protein [Candidatus Walczuchella monophlebidarum]AID37370.1 hypothetical protein FNIIJ_066 [Candidatus Walczuchella monophlebidarum]
MEGQYEPIELRYGGPLGKEVFRENVNRILSQELIGDKALLGISLAKVLVGFHAWTLPMLLNGHQELAGDEVASQDALLQAAEEHFKGSEGMQLKDITYLCENSHSIEDVMDQLVGYANSMCVSTTIISHSETAVERMANNKLLRIEAASQWKAFYSPYLR